MKNNRLQHDDRRQGNVTFNFPIKDSHGAVIKHCRREVPNRRIDYIKAEWIKEIVISS